MACVHHWMIEPARMGLPSNGTCCKCGEAKDFKNYVENGDIQVDPFNGSMKTVTFNANRGRKKGYQDRKRMVEKG